LCPVSGESRGKDRARAFLRPGFFRSLEKFFEFLFFPSFCQICGKFLEAPEEKIVCRKCWEQVLPPPPGHCFQCGRFYELAEISFLCLDCLRQPPWLTIHRSGFPYQGVLKEIILLLKFKEYSCLARPLIDLAFRYFRDDHALWEGVDLLVPVPLHSRREKERGYNQARLLAQALAEKVNLPWEAKVLKRIINSPPQTSLKGKDRRKNVRNVFQVKKGQAIVGRIICLVDDVYTTGATLNECARVLLNAGAKEVRAVTLAQA